MDPCEKQEERKINTTLISLKLPQKQQKNNNYNKNPFKIKAPPIIMDKVRNVDETNERDELTTWNIPDSDNLMIRPNFPKEFVKAIKTNTNLLITEEVSKQL